MVGYLYTVIPAVSQLKGYLTPYETVTEVSSSNLQHRASSDRLFSTSCPVLDIRNAHRYLAFGKLISYPLSRCLHSRSLEPCGTSLRLVPVSTCNVWISQEMHKTKKHLS